jgi:hypothetical protein
MHTRQSTLILLTAALLCGAARGEAQSRLPSPTVPVTLQVSVPVGAIQRGRERPPITTSGVLSQVAGGAVGGAAGLAAVGVPMLFAAFAGMDRPSDAVLVGVLGGGFVTGSTLGVHYMGRRQEMSGSPWATAAGVLAGAGLIAALRLPLVSDDDDYREPHLPLLLPPAAGGTAGYLLTRRARSP